MITITHTYQSSIAEGAGSGIPGGLVGPNEWNANHTISGQISLTADVSGNLPLANMASLGANTILGNNTGGSSTPIALTQAQATALLNTFSSTLQGVVPASGGGTTNFLRADGAWAAAGGGVGGAASSVQFNNAGALGGFGVWDGSAIMSLAATTTAQALRVYNTTDSNTSPVNYERGVFDWVTSLNTLTIGMQAGGTGTARTVNIVGPGGSSISLSSGGSNIYSFPAPLAAGTTHVFRDNASVGAYINWGGQARVTGDFNVANSTVLVNVTGLSVTVAAGRTYTFEACLQVTDAGAGGVQAAIAGTTTATAIQYTGYTIADNAIKGKTNATALATAVGSTTTTETAGILVFIYGTITVNAGGTLTVQMAQNTSNATNTTAKRGSYLIVHDMP